jgi:hypothetical protein
LAFVKSTFLYGQSLQCSIWQTPSFSHLVGRQSFGIWVDPALLSGINEVVFIVCLWRFAINVNESRIPQEA